MTRASGERARLTRAADPPTRDSTELRRGGAGAALAQPAVIDRAPFRCAHAFADVRAPCPRCAAPLWFPTPTAPLARLRCPHAGCEAPLVVTTEGDAHPLATVDAHLAVEAVPLFACPREQVEANLLLTVRALALTYLGAVMGMWLRIQHPASQLIVSSPTLLLIPFFLTRAGLSFWTRRRAARRAAALRGRRLRAAEQLFTADAPSWVPSLPSPAPCGELSSWRTTAMSPMPIDLSTKLLSARRRHEAKT